MIHKPTQEQLAEQFKKIPVELRKAIASSANGDTLFEIGKRHGLLIDKTGELAAETGLLMLGITHPNEFVGNLAERLQVDRQTASTIADDINREIFAPVREHLRALFDISPATPLSEAKPPIVSIKNLAPKNIPPPYTTSLQDLEAELERALMEEKGIQPLSVVKKPLEVPKQFAKPEPSYQGIDPYREQVEEDLPNTQGRAYTPSTTIKKEISEERLPENRKLTSKISPAFSLQPPTTRTQPAPVEEERQVFSPLHTQQPMETAHRSTLSAFRGFNMNTNAPEQKENQKPAT